MHRAKVIRAGTRCVLALVPVWLTGALLTTPGAPLPLRLFIVFTAVLSLVNPAEGLVAVTMVAPLGALVASAFEFPPLRVAEALVMAFLAGWLLHQERTRDVGPAPAPAMRLAAWALGALAIASVAVQVRQFRFRFPGPWHDAMKSLQHAYYVSGDPVGAGQALLLIEGIALASAVLLLLRLKPVLAVRVPDALAASCGVAAAAAAMLWAGIAYPDVLARQARLGYRVAAHVGDVNAAGSYFVLMLGIAGGMTARERGARRLWWAATLIAAAFGVWMSASRSAQIAALVVLVPAAAWAVTHRVPARVRYGALALLLLAGIVASAVRASRLELDPTYRGAGFRTEFTRTSLRMIAERPWFGIGIGQYYARSPLYLSPQLAWTYGQENAHDYFLQLAAELGLLGFLGAAVLVGGLVATGATALSRAPDDHRLLGLFAGLLAFLLTCVTGHPLLVPEVAVAFWVSAGLLLALASPPRVLHRGTRPSTLLTAAAALVVLIASVPARARLPLTALDSDPDVTGRYAAPAGARYQVAGQFSSVFVPADVRRLGIALREVRGIAQPPLGVEVTIDGNNLRRFIVGPEWASIDLDIPPAIPPLDVQRVNIRADRTVGVSSVGQNSEPRAFSVEIGEVRAIERGTR